MVDTQHFCLRWNNYQSSITSAFENLRDDEDFVDVTLACDGKSLKAHRVVLSACSPYFRELLKVRTPRPSRARFPSPSVPVPAPGALGRRETRAAIDQTPRIRKETSRRRRGLGASEIALADPGRGSTGRFTAGSSAGRNERSFPIRNVT